MTCDFKRNTEETFHCSMKHSRSSYIQKCILKLLIQMQTYIYFDLITSKSFYIENHDSRLKTKLNGR